MKKPVTQLVFPTLLINLIAFAQLASGQVVPSRFHQKPALGADALLLAEDSKERGITFSNRFEFNTISSVSSQQLQIQATDDDAPVKSATLVPWRLGVGYNGSSAGSDAFTRLDTFVPLLQTVGESIAFIDGRLLIYEEGDFGGNIALGYRSYLEDSDLLLGGYVAYDNRDAFNKTFDQLGLGLEALGEVWEGRINGYIPVGDDRQVIGVNESNNFLFRGNHLIFEQQVFFAEALSSFDAEVGARIARLDGGTDIRGYAGFYYLTGEGSPDTVGWKLRMTLRNQNNFYLSVGVQDDGIFDTHVLVNVGISFAPLRIGKAKTADNDLRATQLGRSIERNETIILAEQEEIQEVPLTNPETGESWVFQHVNLGQGNSNGTIESPFDTVEKALAATREGGSSEGNQIVYVQSGSNPGIPGFTIPDGVQVLSTGPIQYLETEQGGTIALPLSGTGIFPTVTGTVTLTGRNPTVRGFTITPGFNQSGIIGRNTVNPRISDNNITINAASTATGLAGRGIVLEETSGYTWIDNNRISNAIGEGILLRNVTGTAAIVGNQIIDTQQNEPATYFESAIFVANNRGEVDLTIANNIIETNLSQRNYRIDGIEFNLCRITIGYDPCSGTAHATVNIHNNKIINRNVGTVENVVELVTSDGIEVNLDGGAIADIDITSNQVSGIPERSSAGAFPAGIAFTSLGNAYTDLNIQGNKIDRFIGFKAIGIYVGVGENSTGQFRISGNTLKLTEAESKRQPIGIQWVVQDSNNQITPANNLQEDNKFIGFERPPEKEGPTKLQRLSLESGAVKAPLDPVKEPAEDILVHPQDSSFRLGLNDQTTFEATPDTLQSGDVIYRVIGADNPNGVFGGRQDGGSWSPDPPPPTEAEFRANLAVLNLFNTGEEFIKFPLMDNLNIWKGKVGQQPASIRGYILPGGGNQINPQRTDPIKQQMRNLPPMPTPWNQ